MREGQILASLGVLLLASTASLVADTLVLRDGRRLQGELIGIRDNVVEFEGRRGFAGRERIRVDRADVALIEFDDAGGDPDGRFGGDRDQDRDDRGNGGRPGGLREREVSVNANEPWRDTGITVRAGQTLYFQSSGRVRWGPGRQDGPAGEHDSPRNERRPIPNRPGAALIGRIGEGTDYFIGGDSGPIRVRDSGRLYLGINDDFLQDNSGAFRVAVGY